jgi:hypothetical protein
MAAAVKLLLGRQSGILRVGPRERDCLGTDRIGPIGRI